MNNIKRAIARSGLDWRFLVTIADHIFFFRSRKGREGATRAKRHRPPFIFSRPHVVPWRCGAGGDARA